MPDNSKESDFSHKLAAAFDLGSPWKWIAAVVVALALTFLIKYIFQKLKPRLLTLAKRTPGIYDDVFIEALSHTRRGILFIWLLVPLLHAMDADGRALRIADIIAMIASSFQVAIWGLYAIHRWKENYLAKKMGKDASAVSALGIISTVLQGTLIIALVLVCLSNLGVDIGALVAGLGIGGIAVALAAQNVLGDMFASLSIVLDKPFVVGDFITVGPQMGTVENIGIKTTRVRSLSGEELVFSNKDLLESRIQNFKRMWRRRVSIVLNVPYFTPSDKLAQIPAWMKEFVTQEPKLEFERCHLSRYAPYALEYETVYWVKDADFILHMDLQQKVLMNMLNKLKEEDVHVALPSQALYLEKLPQDLQALIGQPLPPSAGNPPLEH